MKKSLLAVVSIFAALAAAASEAVSLKVDHLERPADIGEHPVFSFYVSGDDTLAYRIRVAERDSQTVCWDSGEVASGETAAIDYAGTPLKSRTHYVWTAAVCATNGVWSQSSSSFMTGAFAGDWADSAFISPAAAAPSPDDVDYPLAHFRKKALISKPVRSAVWSVAALGAFEAYVNGVAADGGRALLKGGNSDHVERRLSHTFDVTSLVRRGTNEFAATVSASWWRDGVVHGFANRPADYNKYKNAFRCVLTVTYDDGTVERTVSDASWQGAWDLDHAASIWDGASFRGAVDAARCEWGGVCTNLQFKGAITPMRGPIVRRFDFVRPPSSAYVYAGVTNETKDAFGTVVKCREVDGAHPGRLAAGETLVVDCGQNWSAVLALSVRGADGVTITVEPGEMLNDGNGARKRGCDGPEGSVYRGNLRTAKARFAYVCSGSGLEKAASDFTYFGFRYLSLRSSGDVEIEELKAVPISSVGDVDMRFVTADARLNRLLENIRWGLRGNYVSVPTDCPQRNERLGWSADTQVFCETALYLANAESSSFLEKWLDDMRDAQLTNGWYRDFAPRSFAGARPSTTGWGDAGVIVPYRIWKMTGERRVIRENWAAMDRFVTVQHHSGGGCPLKRENWLTFGDWLSFEPNDDNLKSFLITVYYVSDCEQMAEMAMAIGEREAADRYAKWAQEGRRRFAERFVGADGLLTSDQNTQTALAYALRGGYFTGAAKDDVIRRLVANVERNGNRLQTGFLGTAVLLDALADDAARPDVAYTLLLQDRNPSWLYSVEQGATTIWERWDSYTKKGGFGSAGMNSFNHYAYGAVGAWMYRTMAGIRIDDGGEGFRRIVLAPKPDRRVPSVDVTFASPYGDIQSAWKYSGDTWTWSFTVPPNTTATVILPDGTKPYQCADGAYTVRLRHL